MVEVAPVAIQDELFEEKEVITELYKEESKGNNNGLIPDEEYV
jgi:hypothetical protein